MLKPFGSPNFSLNAERSRNIPCAYCGKGISSTQPRNAVVVVDGGAKWGTRASDPSDRGYMGEFFVGTDCAKKLRQQGVEVYKEDPLEAVR